MIEGRDFIITSLQPWDLTIGSTIKNTALEISKHNRVLYICTPLDISSRLRNDPSIKKRVDVLKGKSDPIIKINDNLYIAYCPFTVFSINKIPFNRLFDLFNKLNNKKIGKYIKKVTSQLKMKDYIHLIDTDIYRSQYLKELIAPSISIYYCRDYVIGDSYWKNHGERLENKLAAKSDIVLANSTYFAKRFEKLNDKTFPIETGVNTSLYNGMKNYNIPEDIGAIPHPIVGYIGSVNSTRLDIELLIAISRERPEYNLVFVGPEDETFCKSELHNMKNVYFLGHKNVESVPAYISAFDVCINPQLINDVTIGNYPLKADEYLAMGKPMVATETHTMRDWFKDYTHLATSKEEFLKCIDDAMQEVGDMELKEKRVKFAHTHSWENSVKKIYKIIDDYESNH